MNHLITISGPTAAGKTTLSIQLAQHFKTVILSADSRQFYREMSIGTAKPTPEELAQAPHYFVDNLSIFEEYSVGQYEKEALALLEKLFQEHQVVIMVGGSGLFIKAVTEGLNEFPTIPSDIRQALIQDFEAKGIEVLQQELEAKDPEYYAKVDTKNPQRLMRALEVIRASGQTFTHFRNQPKAQRPFTVIPITLMMDREKLYERINLRVDLMLEAGLLEEAKQLYPHKQLNPLQTVGYQELFDCFDNKIDKAEAIRLIKRNSRRYAKRQMTWLRNSMEGAVFEPRDFDGVVTYVEEKIQRHSVLDTESPKP